MILTIAARELRSLFLSPLAWSVMAVVQLILSYVFLSQIDLFLQWQPRLAAMSDAPGVTDVVVAPLLDTAAIVLLLIVPLLSMRLISEESRSRTLPLLLSAPVSMSEIVLGKYLGLLGFLGCLLALIALMPLSLLMGGTLDSGLLAAGLLGLGLLMASFGAAGLFLSTMTVQPTVAALGTLGLLLLLWILDWTGGSLEQAGRLFTYLSLRSHFEALLKGLFDTQDVAYYVLFIVTFLGLAVRRLDAERLHP